MGLLDDAIREHLDLKRRRGADPSEIERAERDALGPVRRAPEELDQEPVPAEDPADAGDEYEYEYDEPAPAEHYVEDFAAPPAGPERDEVEGRGPATFAEPPSNEDDPLPYEDAAVEYEDAAAEYEPEPPPEHKPHVSQETEEYDVADEGPGGEDMLEETPEFLQDTPEHDRLWFEQRPPRDFDFDG